MALAILISACSLKYNKSLFDRVLSRSREVKAGKYDNSSVVAEQHRLQSLEKAMVIQWLCFTPPSTIADAEAICFKLLLRALTHRYVLFGKLCINCLMF